MTRISTYTQYFNNAGGIAAGQDAMVKAQKQTSSQKVSTDLKGYGDNTGRLLSAKSYAERLDRRAETLKALQARAEIEATGLSSASEAVKLVRDGIMNALATNSAEGLRATMEQALSMIGTAANVQYAGQAVFGGDWAYGDPFKPDTLNALAAQPDTNPNWVDTGANRTIMIEDNRSIQLSASAKELFKPFVDFLRDVRVWENANTNLSGKMTPAQEAFLKGQLPGLNTIQTNLIAQEGTAGIVAKQLEIATDQNEAQRDTFNKTIGDQENVDLAEVAARLSAAQTQYQASAAVFAQLKNLNLLQFLR